MPETLFMQSLIRQTNVGSEQDNTGFCGILTFIIKIKEDLTNVKISTTSWRKVNTGITS